MEPLLFRSSSKRAESVGFHELVDHERREEEEEERKKLTVFYRQEENPPFLFNRQPGREARVKKIISGRGKVSIELEIPSNK